MKKRLFTLLLAVCIVTAVLTIGAAADNTWDGSVNTDWYNDSKSAFTINTAADLAGLATLVNEGNNFYGKTITLGDNIDLANKEWTPIGKSGKPFSGTFDGDGKTISNLYINKGFANSAANSYIGLFGLTNSPAVIKNVNIENVDIQGSLYVGAIVGYGFTGSEISNCHISGKIEIDGWWYIGGIGGNGYVSAVKNCTVTGSEGSYIKANNSGSYVGGIWGYRGEGSMIISGCTVENLALSACDRIGGISGIAHYGNTIEKCAIIDSTITSDNNIGNTGLIAGADLGDNTYGIAKILDCTVTDTTATSDGVAVVTKVGSCNHNGEQAEKSATVGTDVTFENGKITGGTLEQVSDGQLAEGKGLTKNTDGTYTVGTLTADNAIVVVASGSTVNPYNNLPAAITAANGIAGTDKVTVTIRQSGSYDMFSITRANVTVEAAEGVTASFTVRSTVSNQLNAANITLKKLNFVSKNGASIVSFGACDSLTLDNCTFTGDGTGTALFIHQPNVTITGCTFKDFAYAYDTCGDSHAAGKITITDNEFININVPFNGYWGKKATDDTYITITGNTFNSGDWDAAYIQIWDYSQYLTWAGSTETDRNGSAIKGEIEKNVYIGNVVIYATHFNWLYDTDSNLTMDDASKALVKYRVLVVLEDAESATVRNADGSAITAFNESNKSEIKTNDTEGRTIIYTICAGDYIFDIVPEGGGDAVSVPVTVKSTTVNASGGSTNTVTAPAGEKTYVAKVGNEKYTSLAEAIEDAKDDGTVELLQDVYVETWDQVWNVDGMTINGNGKTVTIGKVESNVNGNYLFYGAEDLKVNDLTVRFQTNGNGFSMVSGTLDKVKMYGGTNSNYAVFVGNGGTDKTVTVTGCTIENFGIAVYSQPGTDVKTSNIKVTGSAMTDCGIAICSYAQSSEFTGNTVTDSTELSFAGGADAATTVTGNTFDNAGKIWFYGADLCKVTFEKNRVLGNTYVSTESAQAATELDVDKNYWGGGAPSSDQVKGGNVTGSDVYYVASDMNESDLNTYAPYTVTIVYGNGTANKVTNHKLNESYALPAAPSKSGYIFLGWSCNGETYKAEQTVKVTGNMVFTAVWGNLPDVSEPEEQPEPELPFYDVTKGDWFYDAVKYVYYADLMDGVDVGVFAPNDTLTRAMVWTIIARAEGVDTSGGATWYAKAQDWVVGKGISDGTEPNAPITREQLVTMLWRLAGEPALGSGINAPDAGSVSSWAQQAMSWAMYTGLIEGDENGAVTPAATATRAQAAAIMMRYLES